MAKQASTIASLERDLKVAQDVIKQMMTDLALFKLGVTSLGALVTSLVTEMKENLEKPDDEPGLWEAQLLADTSDGN